jgi:curved DNA-binding protein CbpA
MTQEELDALDYYDVLGVPKDATPDAIRAAFHRFANRHHPDRQTGSFDERVLASVIFRRGTEAYRVLMSGEQRVRYDEALARGIRRLVGLSGVSNRPPPAVGVVLTNARARPFVNKALEAIGRGDRNGAKLNLKLALQYDPGNKAIMDKLAEAE